MQRMRNPIKRAYGKAVLGIVGIVMLKKKGKTETRDDTENVVDLNDRFNRARYMDEDGK